MLVESCHFWKKQDMRFGRTGASHKGTETRRGAWENRQNLQNFFGGQESAYALRGEAAVVLRNGDCAP
jgi:hypothetical protein